jgi:Fe2+ transport system protein B
VAISGTGIYELIEKTIEIIEKRVDTKPLKAQYGKEIEEQIEKISNLVEKIQFKYPPQMGCNEASRRR